MSGRAIKAPVTLLIILFLGIQVFEGLTWRDDYPFTRWGMYYSYPSFSPFIDIFVEVDGVKNTDKTYTEPWIVRRRLWSILELGHPNQNLKKPVESYLKQVITNSKRKETEIRELLTRYAMHNSKIETTKIFFRGWETLDSKSIHSPTVEHLIYTGEQ